jgi:arsenate reductase-like glutaredoxin family protein
LEEHDYAKKPLTEALLREIIGSREIAAFLNPRSDLYRERKMKEKPPSKEEAIRLMVKDPNLLKRPVVVKGKQVVVGFDENVLREFVEK